MNLSQKTIDKKFSLPKNNKQNSITRKTLGFTETIDCLFQQTTNKAEIKELRIKRFYTDVYTGSLQIQSYIQSSQKP